jgi:hypothetical protein
VLPRAADTGDERVVDRHVVGLRPPPELQVVVPLPLDLALDPFELLSRQFR